MKIPIVNEQDEVIEYKERQDVAPRDILRISSVWVINKEKKDILVQKRSLIKPHSPGKWSPSAAGTLEEGETYESNAIKELEEEIGLRNVKLIPLKKIFYRKEDIGRFCFVYIAHSDFPKEKFVLQESEVAEIKWVRFDDFYEWFKRSPDEFTTSVGIVIDLIKDYLNAN